MSFYPIATVIIFCKKEEQILFLKRSKPPYDTYYAFPGGKIKLGEPVKNAAIREIYEETGISLKNIALDTILNETYFENDYINSQFFLFYFLAILDTKPNLIESQEGQLKWISVDNLPDRTVPSDLRILENLMKRKFLVENIDVVECHLLKMGQSEDYNLELKNWNKIR